MKAARFTLGVLTALAVAACSRRELAPTDLPTPAKTDIASRFNADGYAWVNLRLDFGDVVKTRAGEGNGANSQWESANTYESAVNDVTLVLLHTPPTKAVGGNDSGNDPSNDPTGTSSGNGTDTVATTERDAMLASKNPIRLNFGDEPLLGTQSEKTQEKYAQRIAKGAIESGDDVYLLVVANAGKLDVSLPATGSSYDNVVKAVAERATKAVDDISTGILMSNAPVSSMPGGDSDPTGATVTTLVKLNPEDIFPTEEEANANPAAEIHLERAAAKVTVHMDETPDPAKDTDGNYHIESNPALKFKISDIQVALDNYNTSTYLCRQFSADTVALRRDASAPYRFVDSDPINPSAVTPVYRTYWAEDLNYSNDALKTDTLTHWDDKTNGNSFTVITDSKPYYPAENTFPVTHQTLQHATAVLVKVQLNGGVTFYTTSLRGNDIILDPEEPEPTEEHGTGAGYSFARRKKAANTNENALAAMQNYLRDWLMELPADAGKMSVKEWVDTYAGGDRKSLIITLTDNHDGTATATVTQTVNTSAAATTAFTTINPTDSISRAMTINVFTSGYCYYRVPIKHFGQTLTPWEKASGMTENTVDKIYGDGDAERAKRYLGRYGVVRNNWYDVSIVGFRHVGMSAPPPRDAVKTPENIEDLVVLKVNITPWLRVEADL